MLENAKIGNIKSLAIGVGVSVLIVTGIISFILSTTADMSNSELGALFNYFWPPILTVITIILFLIACLITKNPGIRLIVLVTFSLYLLYVGLAFHLGKDHWPLVMW